MASELGDRLERIAAEVRQDRKNKTKEWADVRSLIMDVLHEAADGLSNSEAKENNGNGCSFRYKESSLQFAYDRESHKVRRVEYRGANKREYDLNSIGREDIETELEEFVRIASSY